MPIGEYERTQEYREVKRKIALEKGYGKWMMGRTREKCPNWKGGNPKCMDCGIILSSRESKRCHKCWGKAHRGSNCSRYGIHQFGKNSPNWRGGIRSQPDYQNKRSRRLYASNPEFRLKRLISNRNRKTKDKLTLQTVQKVYEDNIKRYGTLTCYLCLKPIPFGKDNLEHKIPLSRGGTNEYNNLAIACQGCNCKKKNKTVEEFQNVLF